MSEPDNPLSEGDIEATNVLPAYLTSLHFGVTEEELERDLGWRRSDLERRGARVRGASTVQHIEIMYRKPRYEDFVLAATNAHEGGSLGIVGLACKTAASVGDAMACHGRYQHLTNRTARYETIVAGERVTLREHRPGPDRAGSLLLSDYTLLVAVRLLRLVAGSALHPLAVRSRRPAIPHHERARFEGFLGAEIATGSRYAELVFDASIVSLPIAQADPELAGYFHGVLARAAPPPCLEAALLTEVRVAIRERLHGGSPAVDEVARALRIGPRTLQRRLVAAGSSFAALLERTRRELADGYLRQPDLTLVEVAYLLGYAEQASFYRAFRRWFGATPDAYRRSQRGEANARAR
jgi:AraC-like DNA-binding protein